MLRRQGQFIQVYQADHNILYITIISKFLYRSFFYGVLVNSTYCTDLQFTLWVAHCKCLVVFCTEQVVYCTVQVIPCTVQVLPCTVQVITCTVKIVHCTKQIVCFMQFISNCMDKSRIISLNTVDYYQKKLALLATLKFKI